MQLYLNEMEHHRQLKNLNIAANKMFAEFEVYALKKGLDIELKNECMGVLKKEVRRRKQKIILYHYTKPVTDTINNFLTKA